MVNFISCGEYRVRGFLVMCSALLRGASICLLFTTAAVADGMYPETTVVVLYEEDGEATINIKNTDAGPALLHSVVENVPEDLELSLIHI